LFLPLSWNSLYFMGLVYLILHNYDDDNDDDDDNNNNNNNMLYNK